MSDFYTGLAATALRLITDKGQALTLKKPDSGTFDPALGKYTADTTGESVTVQAVILPMTKLEDNKYLGDLVAGKLRKILIAASGVDEPIAGDHILEGTNVWEIFGCTPVSPAGIPLLYKAKARKV